MIPAQLFRTVPAGSTVSVDEQIATPDDHGSYGELMDAIDRAIDQATREDAQAAGRRE